jgi:VanZ family protein
MFWVPRLAFQIETRAQQGQIPEGHVNRIAWRLIFLVLTVLVIWLSVKAPGEALGFHIWDKLQHLMAYAALGFAGSLGFPGRKPTIILALGLVFLGAALEVAQSYVPARDMSFGDGVADLLGVAVGIGLGYLIVQRRNLTAK